MNTARTLMGVGLGVVECSGFNAETQRRRGTSETEVDLKGFELSFGELSYGDNSIV